MSHFIKLEATDKALSAVGGLDFFSRTFDQLVSGLPLADFLPKSKIATRCSPLDKFKAMTLGLVAGASCLDDMDRLRQDEGFVAVNGEAVNAARTYDDFLQQFTHESVKKLNLQLVDQALRLHKTQATDDNFVLSVDSTDNKQSGRKIEGVGYNYKNVWGLDTLVAFDQFGFEYWHEVRDGGTFTSNGSPEVIYEVFKRVPRNKHRYFLGDSGFCNTPVFTACLQQKADFVVAARSNMYSRFLPLIKDWHPSSRIKFHDGRKVDIGHTVYVSKEMKRIFRLIVIRAEKESEKSRPLFDDTRFEYAAFITTISQHNMSNEKIIELYRSRANCENFIRDLKYGFDMHHYPCRKLSANKAYAMMMAVAYNLVRYAGYLLNPAKPLFAKAVRFLLVNIPCLVVRHGRYTTLKMPRERLEEVCRLYDKIKIGLGYYASS